MAGIPAITLTKNAVIAMAITAGLGYYYANQIVAAKTCSTTFIADITAIKAKCPDINALDMMKYYGLY
jgi:hypothetical protein